MFSEIHEGKGCDLLPDRECKVEGNVDSEMRKGVKVPVGHQNMNLKFH